MVSINSFNTNSVMTKGIQTNNPAIKYLRMRGLTFEEEFSSTRASGPAVAWQQQLEQPRVRMSALPRWQGLSRQL
jgi:hypothetical protein